VRPAQRKAVRTSATSATGAAGAAGARGSPGNAHIAMLGVAPRKRGPGITMSDLSASDETDLAAHVGAELAVMPAGTRRRRSVRPDVKGHLRTRDGLDEVLGFIEACCCRVRLLHSPHTGGHTMGMMSFLKSAGEKLFGKGEAKAAQDAAAAAPTPEKVAALSAAAGKAITDYIAAQGLSTAGLKVGFDAPSATVTVAGNVDDQATKEKILLCCGNVAGVEAVNDQLVVKSPTPEAQWHTVVSGDNLSKIAKKFYGDANKYPVIFEANKPMLTHPDKIYPGQMLRIPPI
jgi:nucleoid-associated protein YgaU